MNFHYHLLINQASGSGHGAKVGERILQLVREKKFAYDVYPTEYAGHELEIAQKLAEEVLVPWNEDSQTQYQDRPFPLLVVIGGDGTLHQVLNQFLHLQVTFPVAYIPAGSGNDFARGIGLSREPEKAFWSIAKANAPTDVNVLVYEEKIQKEFGLVVNNVGIGLDAAIVNAANNSATKEQLNKFNLGNFAYVAAIINVLFTQKGFPILIEVNGSKHCFDKAFLCTTTNHPYFGGGVAIAPMADAFKNNLDLVIVERIPMVKIFWLIQKLVRKKHTTSKHFHHFSGNKLRIVSTIPEYGQADGEVMGSRPFDITFTTQSQPIWFQKENQ